MISNFINKVKVVWPNLVYLKYKKSVKPLYRLLRPYYIARHYFPFWKNVLNRKERKLYKQQQNQLDAVQQRVIKDLKENGIAVAHLDELFPGKNILQELRQYAAALDEQGKRREKGKTYIVDLFDRRPAVDFQNPFLKLVLTKKVVDIANGYMEMFSKYFMHSLTLVTPVGSADPISSQRWHRDPEDKKLCKFFVYLNDVDEETGPFTYAQKTHADGKWGNIFPQRPPEGRIDINEKKLEEIISKDNFKVATGRAGTVIFCDTAGIHRGGHAKSKERLMFTAGFCSAASLWLPKIVYPEISEAEKITDASVKYALKPWY